MSFLDRFKRKASEEKAPENAPEAKPVPAPESKAEPAAPRKPDPAVQLAAATVAAGYNPDFKLPPKKETPASIPAPNLAGFTGPQHEITLELGDFLQRIPAHLLGDQKLDPATPLSFEVGELADRIARGQTTVPVAEIYRRVPGIFRSQILPADNTEVRFPWQKVMKMLVAHRNQQGSPGAAGLTAAAADSLAEKLRSRRAVRNIIPGSPADTQAQPQASSPPPPPVATPLTKPVEIPIPPANAEEDEKMTKDDAIKARDVMRSLVARMKGEYERHLAAADQQRKSLLEEREKVIVELVRAKKDSDDKNEQVEFEKSVAAKSADNLAKVQQERDSFKIELSNLKVELGKTAVQSDQRIKDLVAERDALAQQQANLSKQITEFQKRGKIGAALTEAAVAATPSGAAAAAAQKQIEELQRRIGVLETAQRDNAQELAREREAKIKAERQLAAADRSQQDLSAAKLQELQGTHQREHDSTLRKRDTESARGLKEVQEQSNALQAANLKLTAELEDTRKKLAAAQEAIAAAPQPEQWEARIANQFESDIESYRTRIKGLLQEKEAINSEKQKLAAQVAEHEKALAAHGEQKQVIAKAEAEHQQSQGDAAQLRAENEKLQGQLKSLQAEFTTVTAILSALQGVEAEHNKTKVDAARARTENENLQAQLKSLQAERESLTAKVQALQGVEAEHNKAKDDIGQARTESETLQSQLKSLQNEREDLQAKIRSLETQTAGTTKISSRAKRLAADNENLTQELAQLRVEQARLTEQHQEDVAKLQQQHAGVLAEKDSSLQQLNATIPTQQSELAQHRAENERLAKELAAATAAVAAAAVAAKSHEALSSEHARVTGELEAARKSSEATISSLRDENQKVLAEREAARKEREALAVEIDKLRTNHESVSTDAGAAKSAHDKALAELAASRDELRAQLASATKEITTLRSQHQELSSGHETQSTTQLALERTLAEVTKNRDELLARIETMAGELAGAKQEHGMAFAALDKDRDSLRASKEALSAEFAAARASQDKTLAELHTNFEKLENAKADTDKQLAEARKLIEELQGKLKSTESSLENTRTALKVGQSTGADQVTEHQKAVAALTGKHERTLAAVVAEKDAAIARIASEKATLAAEVDDKIAKLQESHANAVHNLRDEKAETIAALTEQMNGTVAALTQERDKVRAALTEAERKYPAEIAALLSARDSAQRDSATVAERLASVSVEAEQKHAKLIQERDAAQAEKEKIIAELAEAKETHKAQAGVFASEFKTIVKQRDDALAQLDAERAQLAGKLNDFEKERASFAVNENEVKTRAERDLARLRRERDSIAQQRDALRERLEKLVDEQRQLLEEITAQATFTAMKHENGSVTPEPVPEPESVAPKAREPKKKESNVIDISAAEIVSPAQYEEGRLKIPRVRPVVIPPPQVRVL